MRLEEPQVTASIANAKYFAASMTTHATIDPAASTGSEANAAAKGMARDWGKSFYEFPASEGELGLLMAGVEQKEAAE